jgi:hypothetical protein
LLFAFIAADVMLLPVLPIIYLPISSVICAWLLVTKWSSGDLRLNHRGQWFAVALILSEIASLVFKPATVLINNGVLFDSVSPRYQDFKHFLYILLGLLIYVVSRHLATIGAGRLERVFRWVIAAVLISIGVVYVLFVVSYENFVQVRGLWFQTNVDLSGLGQIVRSGYLSRYSFLLLDPNNGAYYMLMIAAFALHNLKLHPWLRVYCLLLILAVPFITGSLGALVSCACYLAAAAWVSMRAGVRSYVFILGCFLGCAILGVILLDSQVGLSLQDQLVSGQSGVLQRWESQSLTSRSDNWIKLIASGLPPLIGAGYVISMNGVWCNPHSDHLRMLYSYGIVAYACIAAEAFKGKYASRRFLFLIPVICAFSINSLIDEPRFLLATFILVAFAKSALASDPPPAIRPLLRESTIGR